jgi:hypothetical protein
MSQIPELTPNADIAVNAFDKPITIDSINITDIKTEQPCMCTTDSMAPCNIETINNLNA